MHEQQSPGYEGHVGEGVGIMDEQSPGLYEGHVGEGGGWG